MNVNEIKMWFLLYSKNQETLHIDHLDGMLRSNHNQIFVNNAHADFVVIAVFDSFQAANAACPEWRERLGLNTQTKAA